MPGAPPLPDALRPDGAILDQLGVAVIVTDPAGTITYWNRRAEELYGWTPAEAIGRGVIDLLVPAAEVDAAGRIMVAVREGRRWEGELPVRRKDGTEIVCRITDSPLLDADGRVVGSVGMSTEVGAAKRAERRLAARTSVTRILAESDDLDDAAPRILEAIGTSLDWHATALWTVDEERGALVLDGFWRAPAINAASFHDRTLVSAFAGGEGLPGRVWASAGPLWIEDLSTDANFARTNEASEAGLRSGLAFPVKLGDHVLAVLELFSVAPRQPDDDLLHVLGIIASQIGQFMERKAAEAELRRSEERMRAVLQTSLDAIVLMDERGDIVDFNPAAERTFGYARDEAVGREMAGLLVPPELRDRHREGLRRFRETHEGPILGRRIELSGLRADGAEFPAELSITPSEHDGSWTFTGFVRDITGRREAEEALRESRDQLRAIFQGVAEGITVQGPDGGLLFANDEAARMIGFSSGEELVAAPISDIVARFELTTETGERIDPATLPGRRALLGDEPGEMVVRWRSRETGEDRWSLLRSSAVRDGAGNVRFAVNIFHDITERKRAEDAQRFLAEAGPLLASAVTDYEETLARVAELAVPRLADWCAIQMPQDDGTIRSIKVAHVDPAKVRLAEELGERYPPDPDSPTGVPNVLRTGRSEIYPELTPELLAASGADEEQLRIVRDLQLRSIIVVPMTARGHTVGAITFVGAESGRTYGPDDLALAEDLASRAALAVENARLYRERDHIARTLQRNLLPPALPSIPYIDLGARYRAAGAGNEVGGDFYDVFETADGSWAVVVGDVCGKGPEAAAVTGLARYTIRAAAMRDTAPSRVLETLNDAVLQQRDDHLFCTVAYVRVRPQPDAARLTVSVGGHPLPLVLRADGTVETAGTPGTLIGIFPDPELSDRVTELAPGDTLLLFTDGVTEEHAGEEIFGRTRVEEALAALAGADAATIVERIEAEVLAFRHEEPRDDIALLAIRMVGE